LLGDPAAAPRTGEGKGLTVACCRHNPFYHEGDLLTQPLDLGPPYAKVPEGPGLGVELDEEQVKRWRIDQ